jgi:hypothetical protein
MAREPRGFAPVSTYAGGCSRLAGGHRATYRWLTVGAPTIARRYPSFVRALLGAAAIGTALSSCGNDKSAPSEGGAGDAGDAGTEAGPAEDDGGACQPFSDAAEPPLLAQLDLDGGVPLDQLPFALAVARCDYFNHCSPMAAYELNECVNALSQGTELWISWSYVECSVTPPGYACGGGYTFSYPNPALAPGVDAGFPAYDPNQEAACLRALQAQSCHGTDLWYDIPDCPASLPWAPSGAALSGGDDGGSADADVDSAADGGAIGADSVLKPCKAASDCAGLEAGLASGPYCVDGYCYSSLCGDFLPAPDGGCLSFVESGEPCDSDPPRLGNGVSATPWHAWPTKLCASGLTCQGLSTDGGLGTCATPGDVGAPCSESATISGCALGLICQCGACRIPPSHGACASGACEIGVAYCDIKSNTCMPVELIGGDCTDAFVQCAPNLTCDPTTNTCQPPMP